MVYHLLFVPRPDVYSMYVTHMISKMSNPFKTGITAAKALGNLAVYPLRFVVNSVDV